jgi:hypothetical protein
LFSYSTFFLLFPFLPSLSTLHLILPSTLTSHHHLGIASPDGRPSSARADRLPPRRRPALLRAHRPASSAPARRRLHRPAPPLMGSGRAAWLLRLARSAPWAPPPRANGGKGMAELQRERAERQFSAPSRGFSSSQPIFRAILCGSSFFGRVW